VSIASPSVAAGCNLSAALRLQTAVALEKKQKSSLQLRQGTAGP